MSDPIQQSAFELKVMKVHELPQKAKSARALLESKIVERLRMMAPDDALVAADKTEYKVIAYVAKKADINVVSTKLPNGSYAFVRTKHRKVRADLKYGPDAKEAVLASAKQYQSKSEWQAADQPAYAAAKRYGWFEEAAAHMPVRKPKSVTIRDT